MYCDPSLEPSRRDGSNEMFYVRCCSLFNVLILTLLCVQLFNLVKVTELPLLWERAANSA